MGHTLFTQVLAARLPMQFWGDSVIDQLKHLEDAGYIKVAFSPPHGAAPPRATVNEITHLGRAVARYCGTDDGFSSRPHQGMRVGVEPRHRVAFPTLAGQRT
ncbi:hypothetical protein [Variovorax sp. OV700]|jgi:hypothetical protein|uniref:hypothetical protein n=1 Tax=Variovorax sp. OV700 TaxID=1882826 RepID=UPI00088202B0|nr:hypothetical protein [Variovorax sp. OV700]SDJ54001.1 hypothetical protein SAMN05444748_11592 [Variovorax sp. OV700]